MKLSLKTNFWSPQLPRGKGRGPLMKVLSEHRDGGGCPEAKTLGLRALLGDGGQQGCASADTRATRRLRGQGSQDKAPGQPSHAEGGWVDTSHRMPWQPSPGGRRQCEA